MRSDDATAAVVVVPVVRSSRLRINPLCRNSQRVRCDFVVIVPYRSLRTPFPLVFCHVGYIYVEPCVNCCFDNSLCDYQRLYVVPLSRVHTCVTCNCNAFLQHVLVDNPAFLCTWFVVVLQTRVAVAVVCGRSFSNKYLLSV